VPTTKSHGKEINPALAGFVSGAASTILTIAATLVSLQADASREGLFLALSWIMYAAAATTALVLAWIVVGTLRDSVHELRHLKELEVHVSRFIRYRRRDEEFRISPNGDVVMRLQGEVECAIDSYAPWLTLPIFTGTAVTAPEWKSAIVRLVSVDGVNSDPTELCMRKSRSRTVDEPDSIIEEIAIRIPITLGAGRRRCTYVIEVEAPGLCQLGERDELFFATVAHITDEINLHVVGTDGLRISFSPNADYRVRASQLSGELLDAFESQLQSAECQVGNGIHWRSHNSKIGYRYELRYRAANQQLGQ
jgi:hypothetical protein